jgi:crotonobetainyl-CoA:carnitine CoA-transferase CaiB-like acyl-CoA transferase
MLALAGLPLRGLLVVSLEEAVAAPLCTSRLAEAGARVIKIERAEGDFARGYDHVVHGESAYFVWLNRPNRFHHIRTVSWQMSIPARTEGPARSAS